MSVTSNRYIDQSSFLSSNQLYQSNSTWAKELKEYDYNRKHLAWGVNVKPHVYTQKEQKQKENIFNPISQQYYDSAYNSQLKYQEMKQIKNEIVNNYDNELRNEQTFDIISLKDRLKGFENHPNYPKPAKEKIKLNKEVSQVPYNILNHRDKQTMQISTESINQRRGPEPISRDYNLITNDYIVNNELKNQTDFEIEQLTAAKKLQQTRSDYDYIKGAFYDSVKQTEYERQQAEFRNKQSLFKSEVMYNPVNHHIYNKDRVDKYDHAQDNLKKRYRIKPLIEEFHRQRQLDREYTKDKQIENKLNYQRYKVEDQRGYNVINLKNNYSAIKDMLNCANKKDTWDILKENAGENETLSKKGVFKDPHDTSEIAQNDHQYKQKRYKILKDLGDYRQQLEIKKINEKIRDKPIETEVNEGIPMNIIDKKKWFSTGKSVDMIDFKRVSIINV